MYIDLGNFKQVASIVASTHEDIPKWVHQYFDAVESQLGHQDEDICGPLLHEVQQRIRMIAAQWQKGESNYLMYKLVKLKKHLLKPYVPQWVRQIRSQV